MGIRPRRESMPPIYEHLTNRVRSRGVVTSMRLCDGGRRAPLFMALLFLAISWGLAAAPPPPPQKQSRAVAKPITFYDDVQPLLQKRCLRCHGASGRIAPMSLTTYSEVRAAAAAIQEAVKLRKMPPWFADPAYGPYTNEPHLTDAEIRILDAWVATGHQPGKMPPHQRAGWKAPDPQEISADLSVSPLEAVSIPANASLANQYFVYALPFTHDRWVKAVELRSSDRSVVDHAIVYVRQQQSTWLRNVRPGVPYSPPDPAALQAARTINRAEVLAVFTPGSPAVIWPDGAGKKLPTGADLVLEIHYVNKGAEPSSDQPQIGMVVTSEPPARQIMTMEVSIGDPRLQTAEPGYKSAVAMALPGEVILVGLRPFTNLPGLTFDVDVVDRDGTIDRVLKTMPNKLDWQAGYSLRNLRILRQGSALRWTAITGDRNNRPLPQAGVVVGYFDVAVIPTQK